MPRTRPAATARAPARSSAARRCGAAIAAAATLAGCGPAEPPPPPARPNLLLVTLDTVRADHLGLYGYARETSPALDALAKEAVVFEAAQAASSWTLPSLASIHTGVHPTTHGCDVNEAKLPDGAATLAETLRAAGYQTAAVVSHVFASRRHGMDQGFEHFDEMLVSDDAHRTVTSQWITLKALRWLDSTRQGEQPWLLWLHYFDPHFEYRAHAGVSEPFGLVRPIDLYDGELAFTDASLGRLLHWLAGEGLLERTVVAVVADHGEEFGEHGHTLHRQHLYAEVLRVPFLIRAPGFEARRVRATVGHVDLAPTLLALLGVEAPGSIAGRSLVPAMRGDALPARPALAELRQRDGVERALVSGRWKLVRHPRHQRDELYDTAQDPGDLADQAAEHSDVVRELGAELESEVAEAERQREAFGEAARIELGEREREALRALGYGEER